MSTDERTHRPLLDILLAAAGNPEMPEGCDTWAFRSVWPDFTSSRGFRWPLPGNWAEATGTILDHRGSCPRAVGDGICVATTAAGMASGGIPASTILLTAHAAADVVGDDEPGKLRVRRARVVDVLWIKRANLGGADLRGANLGDANLRDANLQHANLGDAYLRGADLRGANLRGAYLGGANLQHANLGGADLRGANLRGANLGDANLWDANLGDAYLGGAYLGDTNLGDAYLRDANLGDANLWDAVASRATLWPEGFDPDARGVVTR